MLLIFARFFLEFGCAIYTVGVTWYIIGISGDQNSGLYLAYFYTCLITPSLLFGAFCGVYLDKYNRKIILSSVEFISALFFFILVLFLYYEYYLFIAILVTTVLMATVGVFYKPAIYSILPCIVKPGNLIKANSYNMGVEFICSILGAAFVGFFYKSIGLINLIVLTGILFVIFGVIILFIRLSNSNKNRVDSEEYKYWKSFKSGLFYIINDKSLLVTLVFMLIINFFSTPFDEVLLPKIIKFTLHMGANEYGFLKAVFPIGSIVGLIICSILPKRKKVYRTVFYFGAIILGVAQLLFALPIIPYFKKRITVYDIFIIYCAIAFIKMIFDAFINVPLFTVFQLKVPDDYRGRFFSLQNTALMGTRPLSVLMVGFISTFIASYLITFMLGIILLILVILVVLSPAVKELFDVVE